MRNITKSDWFLRNWENKGKLILKYSVRCCEVVASQKKSLTNQLKQHKAKLTKFTFKSMNGFRRMGQSKNYYSIVAADRRAFFFLFFFVWYFECKFAQKKIDGANEWERKNQIKFKDFHIHNEKDREGKKSLVGMKKMLRRKNYHLLSDCVW